MQEFEFTWYQKYRPKNINELIVPDRIKKILQNSSEGGGISYTFYSESGGTGKTTAAYLYAEILGCKSPLKIKASLNNGIDIIRERVFNYISTKSAFDDHHVVILDEADGLSPGAQESLKSLIEECTIDTTFIITTNNLEALDERLLSRCKEVRFEWNDDERKYIKLNMWKRCVDILKQENIPYDVKTLQMLINDVHPDNRNLIQTLQSYAITNGKIDEGILTETSNDGNIDENMSD